MFYQVIAALCLLPASFVVFGRTWFRSLRSGPWYFFGQVVKAGPQLVLKRGRLFNLCVFYPMRAGIEIIRRRSLCFVFRRFVGLLLRRFRGEPPVVQPCPAAAEPAAAPLPQLSFAALARMVENPEVAVVSLDIFDTLLTRPVINDPRDIFYLIAARVDARYGLDFVAMRWNAETEMGDRYASIDAVYEHLRQRNGLSEDVAHALKAEELLCERTLLRPREGMLEVCRAAARAGKRIVAVSDMYLPSDFLLDVLHEKGFTDVAAVYVSAEHKARKTDSGALFDVMLRAEGVAPGQTLHLGDNPQGDVAEPLRKGMMAVHVPSVLQMLEERGGELRTELAALAHKMPLWGLLLGHALENVLSDPENAPETLERCDAALLARLALGPLVTSLCLRSREVAVREGYERIYYASRDGWLPSRVYEIVREALGGPEGCYFYAGRRAYFPFLSDSFAAYARTRKIAADLEHFTLEAFLTGHFGKEAAALLAEMTDEERSLPFCKEQQKALRVLARLSPVLEQCMAERRERAQRYYSRIFSQEAQRYLVFDIGYCGSVSVAVTAITGKPADKLYCWQNESNQKADLQKGTRTFLLIGGEEYSPFHIVLEELFAPCAGGVLDFDEQGQPVLEDIQPSQEMDTTLRLVHQGCLEYARGAVARFGEYMPALAEGVPNCIPLLRQWFHKKALSNLAQFRSIVFPDPVYQHRMQSLEEKLDRHLSQAHVFASTGFEDDRFVLPLWKLCPDVQRFRIGIHMHIYNVELAQQFARYAAAVPVEFDLFVTYSRTEDAPSLQVLFSRAVLPHVRDVYIRRMPNRGRDVAPWLAGIGREQTAYDLFCHVHAKESGHMGFGALWRTYLLDNLLRPEAIRTVVAAFAADSRLGCVFPAMFGPLRSVMLRVGVPLYGSEEERDMITGLLARMGLPSFYGRNEQFFSGGTMLWYRTAALRPLLECGLRFEDFPEEPIGVGGTLAHALERVPALVCSRCGYSVRTLTLYPDRHYKL